MATQVREIRFPAAGVGRRLGYQGSADTRLPYSAPWAVNVRPVDPLAHRTRGGSRTGLTRLLDDPVGTSIAELVSLQVGAAGGGKSLLVVLVDNALGVVDDGVLTFPFGALLTESGANLVTEDGERIVLSAATAPAAAFLVAGQQKVYAVSSSTIIQFDPKTGVTTDLEATQGSVPTGCTFGCLYRDRLLLAGADNGVYLSRQGVYTDWDYGANAEDTGRAIPFQLSEAGEVGATPTAAIPHKDAFLLAATSRTLWAVRGDPAAAGSLNNVSRDVGVISPSAWCKVGDVLFFLALDGLYKVGPDGGGLENLSEDRIPDELLNIDTSTTTVRLGYSHSERGVHLYLTTAAGSDTHWFFDLATKTFWPDWLADDHAPVAVCQHDGRLLLAGGDGCIRYVGGEDDDGQDIVSHVLLGPIRLGGPGECGLIQSLRGVIADGSGWVTWRVVTGDTAEEAATNAKAAVEAFRAGESYGNYVQTNGVWDGQSFMDHPRVRAMWAVLWLQSREPWGYESITMETAPFGRWR